MRAIEIKLLNRRFGCAIVQDDVRYFGIEVGANFHAPSDPSTIFARRFGNRQKTQTVCARLDGWRVWRACSQGVLYLRQKRSDETSY